jgi:hypothetical protein
MSNMLYYAKYNNRTMIGFVSQLLSLGFIVKLTEHDENKVMQETMFKRRQGQVFAKGRKIIPQPCVDEYGWELRPLSFEDWWVDIIVDGLLTQVSVIRYSWQPAEENIVVWDVDKSFLMKKPYHTPPSNITSCKKRPKAATLKELAVLCAIDNLGTQILTDIQHTLDNQTLKTAKASIEWWVTL